MHEIFISYRRNDTTASAGHLYEALVEAFGPDSVFMDTRGEGIPWGTDYELRLQDALAHCEVLLALIGPVWLSCQRDGQRRLDAPDDWVRREIAAALRRGVPVLPVLLLGGRAPSASELPAELRELHLATQQGDEISEKRWQYDVQRLVDRLGTRPALRALLDRQAQAAAPKGIGQLKALIHNEPRVTQAVARARTWFEDTHREVAALTRIKGVHDVLHGFEDHTLIPLRTSTLSRDALQAAQRNFQCSADLVRTLLKDSSANDPHSVLLHEELPNLLGDCGRALKAAQDGSEPKARFALSKLEGLISYAPRELNRIIEFKAQALQLRFLADNLRTIRDFVGPGGAANDELKPLQQPLQTLDALSLELEWRVMEHGRLQALDGKLRRICKGEHAAAGHAEPLEALQAEWVSLRHTLKDLRKPPRSTQLQAGLRTFNRMAREIGVAIASKDEAAALARLRGFHNVEVGVFLQVNGALKGFLEQLRQETGPAKTVLEMCPVGDPP